jgi:Ca2+-binding EF-hand superfamily protein
LKIKALFILGLTLLVCPGCVMAVLAAARAVKPKEPAPIVKALDTNRDGEIDATEMANASASLKALDRNNDGTISSEELKSTHRK